MLTKEQIDKLSHISTKTILEDISDTKIEIITMRREIKGFELLSDRMSMFRASARRTGIKEREEFIEKLEKILEMRRNINYGI